MRSFCTMGDARTCWRRTHKRTGTSNSGGSGSNGRALRSDGVSKMTVLALLGLRVGFGFQDTPVAIPKGTLPKKAKCLVCSDHGEEKPAAGFLYKGKSYYFCNTEEAKAFRESPEMYFVPRPMPEFSIADKAGKAWNA